MSISPTSLKCPACGDRMLDAISVHAGNWLSCPHCTGIYIHEDLLAKFSKDPSATRKALDETRFLLLPTKLQCPQCTNKLYEGASRTRGLIFSLCTACQQVWTFLPVLANLD